MNELLNLFMAFFRIGAFTFGGGYAMIPMIQQDILSHGWLTQQQLIDFIAISESTPGPFAVNIATFVGMSQSGVAGAVCATLGVVLPSFLIILIVAKWFGRIQENIYVKAVFYGLRPASIALIAASGINVVAVTLLDLDKYRSTGAAADLLAWKAILLGIVLFAAQKRLKWSPVAFIAISAAVGIIFKF